MIAQMRYSMKTMNPLLKTETRMMLVALACPVLFAGCSFAPKYAKPSVPTPAAFKELTPAQFKETDGWKTAEPKDDAIRGQWWEMFADTNLNALEAQVNISNQTVAAAFANFLSARAVVKQSLSQFFPTVTTSPSITEFARGQCVRVPLRRVHRSRLQITRCRRTRLGSWISGAAFATPIGQTNSKPWRRWPIWKTHG